VAALMLALSWGGRTYPWDSTMILGPARRVRGGPARLHPGGADRARAGGEVSERGVDVLLDRHTVTLSAEQLQYIAHTEFVPKSMRGNLPAILACVAMGRELGLGDMVALRTIHVIDGRTALSAEAMVALVRQRGHSIQGNFSADSCTVTGKRADNGDEMTVTWTKQMAIDAGLANKSNWKSYAPAMLWARAVSQLSRMLFADCFAGSTHTPEEISDGDFERVRGTARDRTAGSCRARERRRAGRR